MDDIELKKQTKNEKKLLQSLIESAIEASSELEFFQIIVEAILPKLRISNCFLSLRSKWVLGKETYGQQMHQIEEQALIEIKQTFEYLKVKLIAMGPSLHPIILDNMCSIEHIFQQEEKQNVVSFSYVEVAYQQIKLFLAMLLCFGMDEIVSSYGRIKISGLSMMNPFAGNLEVPSKFINEFTFAPSFIKKQQLVALFHKNEIEHCWIAIELIYLLEWCWNAPGYFFEDTNSTAKINNHENARIDLHTLHSYWLELDKLKKDSNENKVVSIFFKRKKFISCLNVIVKEMFPENYNDNVVVVDSMINCFLDLELITNNECYLALNVYSASNLGSVKRIMVHKYQGKTSSIFKITDKLLNAPVGEWVNVIEIGNSDGVKNLSKYFERGGLKNILGRIFFDRDGPRMRLKSDQGIKCNDLSKTDRLDLQNYIMGRPAYVD